MGWVRGDQAASPKVAEELAELTRENRKLKEKLESLQRVNDKKALIKLDINNNETIELDYHKYVNHPRVFRPKKIDFSSISEHLLPFINEEDVEDYNHTVLEEAKKVEEYNKESRFYTRLDTTGLELDLTIANVGELKANNIYVEVEFPPEVTVLEGEKKDFTEPSVPALKMNPLEKAESRYEVERKGLGLSTRMLDSFARTQRVSTLRSSLGGKNLYGMINSSLYPPNPNFKSSLDGNKITIYSKDLLHTRTKTCSKSYVLIPKQAGEYEIKVSVICEEYTTRDEFTIPLVIHESEK